MIALLASLALGQDYSFPTSAEDHGSYYPTAYMDHGGVDWNCGSIRYSGHDGSDFGGGSFDGMEAGRDVVAAAVGVVNYTHDGEFDACTTGDCPGGGGFGNHIRMTHPNGTETIYAHLKQWSVSVSVGDVVACGDKMGEMGSSGYSTGPHLHFEVRELGGSYTGGSAVEPFDGPCAGPPSYWSDQGVYDGLPALSCDDPTPCTPQDLLSCGAVISASSADGHDHVGYYGIGEYVYTGPEIAWEFVTDRTETATISVSGHSADVDLFVLGSSACDATDAIAQSTNGDTEAESISFEATAGERYTLVVDGWDGAVSSFELAIDCEGALPDTGDGVVVDTALEDSGGADTSVQDSAAAEDTAGIPGPPSSPPPPEGSPSAVGGPGVRLPADRLGCGCATGLPAPAAWALGLGVLLGRRRRRPARRGSDRS